MHILMAAVEALEVNPDNLVLNRTSLQDSREENRRTQYDEAKSNFIDDVIRILHACLLYNNVFFSFLILFFTIN